MTPLLLCLLASTLPQEPGSSASESLPRDLALREEGPQRFVFICDYLATDEDDAFVGKQRIEATYVRDPEQGKVRWENVRLARASELDAEFSAGESVAYMEGFSYEPKAGFAMFLPAFFKGFPLDAQSALAKNLVWDTHMLEQFGWSYFSELELGVPFSPSGVASSKVPLAGMGAFKNRKIEITWVGETRRNGERCALLQYEAFFNRFDMNLGATQLEGLSHYWGLICVSLEDKQIEHATLNEHVSLRQERDGARIGRNFVLRRGELRKEPAPK